MSLYPSEQAALDFVTRIGIIRANRILSLIAKRIERRATKGRFFTLDFVRREPWEVDLMHQLKIGLMLSDTDSPYAAHQRILARIAQRNAQAQAKKSMRASTSTTQVLST